MSDEGLKNSMQPLEFCMGSRYWGVVERCSRGKFEQYKGRSEEDGELTLKILSTVVQELKKCLL